MAYQSGPPVVLPENLIRIPLSRQSSCWTCGVAALQSYLRYFGVDHEYREDTLVEELKSHEDYGTKYFEMMRWLKEKEFTAECHTGWTVEEVKLSIDSGTPIMVCFQAWVEWAEGDTIDWTTRWDDGHYSIICGYSEDSFFFMDPSSMGCYTYIPIVDFMKRWHDFDETDKVRTDLVHWGMTIKKDVPKDNKLHLFANYLG